MKRMIYLAAALLLAACSQETLPETNEIVETPEAKTYTVSLMATFDPETRLSFDLSNEGTPEWDQNDKVALFTHKGKKIEGKILPNDFNVSSPTFTFTLDDDDKIDEGAKVYYPASIAVEDNPDQIVLPASYDNVSDLGKSFPMKAVVSGQTMAFKHLASIISVAPFTSTPSYPNYDQRPQTVEFSVQGSNAITGKFTVNNDLSLTASGDNGTTIIAPWALNEPYYFVLPPATYQFSVSIKAADGFIYYKKSRTKTPYEAARRNLLPMPAFDPQCKEFYLTSAETNWSDNVTSARMIQTGSNSFLGALDSHRGPKGDQDVGLRILQGFNLGTDWFNVIGGRNDNDTASYGESVGNFPGGPRNDSEGKERFGVYKVSITLYDNNWRYTSEWVDFAWDLGWDKFGNPHTLKLVGDFDGWDQGGIHLNQIVRHNWATEVEVSETAKIRPGQSYEWKIKRDDNWDINWGQGTITETQLSSFNQIQDNEHQSPGNGTLNLPAGTYTVFFNDATGWIMFEKK